MFRYLFLWLFLSVAMAKAGQLTVCNTCPINDLHQAVAQAAPHDTVNIQAGNYAAIGIIIDKPLTLLGEKERHFGWANTTAYPALASR